MCMTNILGACVLAAQLTGGGTYTMPTPEIAYSYDGVARDVSHFYEPDNTQFSIAGGVLIEDTLIHVNYDNGFSSDKLTVNDSTTVHVTQSVSLTDKLSVSITAGMSFGGEREDTSCKDSYGREYYCGTLTAWSDYQPAEQETYKMGKVKLSYRF